MTYRCHDPTVPVNRSVLNRQMPSNSYNMQACLSRDGRNDGHQADLTTDNLMRSHAIWSLHYDYLSTYTYAYKHRPSDQSPHSCYHAVLRIMREELLTQAWASYHQSQGALLAQRSSGSWICAFPHRCLLPLQAHVVYPGRRELEDARPRRRMLGCLSPPTIPPATIQVQT